MARSDFNIRTVAGLLSRSLEPLTLWLHGKSKLGAIFLFHRVSNEPDSAYPPLSPSEFELQCAFFRRNFELLPLAELVSRAREGKSLKGLAALTFDDGYRDFLTVAYPILRQLAMPCTHFLVEDCVRTGKPTWNLRLRHLFPDREIREKKHAEIVRLPAAERNSWLDAQEANATVHYPPMLREADLGAVNKGLVSWQSHTASHALLTQSPPAELERELAGSRKALEEWTGEPVRYLSYPNGACNVETRTAARRAGYEGAFEVGQRRVRSGCDAFAIPRIDVGALPRSMLASEISGLHPALRRLF